MDTWESRMAQRARRAAIKRRMRQNLEGEPERHDWTLSNSCTVFIDGCESVTAIHWALIPKEDEWPDVVTLDE